MELNRENGFLDCAYTGKCRRCHHEDSLSEFRQFYLTCIGTDDPSATDENEPSIKKAKFDQAVDGVNDHPSPVKQVERGVGFLFFSLSLTNSEMSFKNRSNT